MTKKWQQKLLNRLVSQLHGIGRCVLDGTNICQYVKEGHPGCGIGCQRGFRTLARKHKFDKMGGSGLAISFYVQRAEMFCITQDLHRILGLDLTDDKIADVAGTNFLCSLQTLHDNKDYWRGKLLKKGAVRRFVEHWGLEMPVMEVVCD